MDIFLIGSYTRFSCSLIKWKTQRAKITIPPFHPLYPIPSPPTGWTNEPINEFRLSQSQSKIVETTIVLSKITIYSRDTIRFSNNCDFWLYDHCLEFKIVPIFVELCFYECCHAWSLVNVWLQVHLHDTILFWWVLLTLVLDMHAL